MNEGRKWWKRQRLDHGFEWWVFNFSPKSKKLGRKEERRRDLTLLSLEHLLFTLTYHCSNKNLSSCKILCSRISLVTSFWSKSKLNLGVGEMYIVCFASLDCVLCLRVGWSVDLTSEWTYDYFMKGLWFVSVDCQKEGGEEMSSVFVFQLLY